MAKRTKSRNVILPTKMSKLIRVALKDLKKAENTPGYIIDMSDWHQPDELVCQTERGGVELKREEVCLVCFAGAVMAGSLKAPMDEELGCDDFPGNERQLDALNSLRRGDVRQAAKDLELYDAYSCTDADVALDSKFGKLNAVIPEYEYEKRDKFHAAMEKLAAKLEKAGF